MGLHINDALNKVNDATALTLLPVMILLCIYMLLGLFGNPLVVMYYGCHVKPSPSYYFIVAMAVFDITVCCVSMPLEIMDLRFPYNFPSKAACKVLRAVNYFACISSGLVLVAIAVDRYRKVCQPFETQISKKMTKIIIGMVCFFSLSVSWPAFIFYDLHPVANITATPGVIGHDCTFTRESKYQKYIMAYIGVGFLVFIGCIVTLIVLYILIGRKLCQINKFRFSSMTRKRGNKTETPPTSVSEADIKLKRINDKTIAQRLLQTKITLAKTTSGTESGNSTPNMSCDRKLQTDTNTNGKFSFDVQNDSSLDTGDDLVDDKLSYTSSLKSRSLRNLGGSDVDIQSEITTLQSADSSAKGVIKHQKKQHDRFIHIKKYTILMFLVSLAFIISFLPYLGLLTWKTLANSKERYLLSDSELVAYNIFVRSWMISSALNPYIYGFCNVDFRSFVYYYLRHGWCNLCRSSDNTRQSRHVLPSKDVGSV